MFKGVIRSGNFIPYESDVYQSRLNELEGETVEVEIKKYKHTRSEEQNRLYWRIVDIISDKTGYDRYETHALLGSMFLKDHADIQEGEVVKRYTIVKSTSSLKSDEMSEYIEKVKQFASVNLGLYIPD